MKNRPQPTVVLVEDHPLMRASLRVTFERAGFTVVGEATSEVELVAILRERRPDVALVDLFLGAAQSGMRCLEALRARAPATKAIVFSGFDDRALITEALGHGASAFIHKSAEPAEIIEIVELVLEGKEYVAVHADGDDTVALTTREQQILACLVRGLTNRQISEALWITEQTVKFHLTNVYRKLEVKNRAQAVAWALRR